MHRNLISTAMPAISIRAIPGPLYESLKATALANHRSLNKEVIVALEAHIRSDSKSPDSKPAERLAAMRQLLESCLPNQGRGYPRPKRQGTLRLIVVDSSALVAIVLDEPEAQALMIVLANTETALSKTDVSVLEY
jgi:hypothetical protein